MKKYFVLLLLSFVLVSCGKQENQPITTTEIPKNTEQKVSESKESVNVENDSISNNKKIIETGSGKIVDSSKDSSGINNSENKIIDGTKWIEYKNSELGFSFAYPEKAYMKTKCGSNTQDELINLKVFESGSVFTVGYTKRLNMKIPNDINSCEIVDNNDGSLKVKIFNANSKEEFVNKIYNKGICIIEKTEKWSESNNLEQIYVTIKPEIKECIKNNTCIEYSIWDCTNYSYDLYNTELKKGVTIQYSNADYFIQKYPTYKETMDKGSYDKEIANTFKFE